MGWRETFARRFGPGLLGGITSGDWLALLRDNEFTIAPRALPRAIGISIQSVQNSAIAWSEDRADDRRDRSDILPPVFILGHWRSGTTHLHNLLALDDRFAFPNTYQVSFPHTFLATEARGAQMLSFFLPKRRPMDNIEWSMRSPQEDEFALCVASQMSPCLGWVFPERREHYDRYLTLRGIPAAELARWRQTLLRFLEKLTWKYHRPLVLKSPPHTCRIRLLLEMFPQAKFVHLHRDPHAVFQSSRRMFTVNFEQAGLQRLRLDDLDEWILRQYEVMYEAFFDERGLIPEGQFHEVGFESLERDPTGEVRRLYGALGLPAFDHAEPAVRSYLDSVAGYEKNRFGELSAGVRTRIAGAWRRCFEEWGYAE